MSEILKSPVFLDKLFAVPFFQTREQYEAETGKPCPPYDPGRRLKYWEDANADTSEFLVSYLALAIDKNDPMGRPLLKDGGPHLKVFQITPEDAARVNIPPNVSGFARLSTPAYPVPLNWDGENYELYLRSPFDQLPWVRDKRAAVELTDHEMIKAIYERGRS